MLQSVTLKNLSIVITPNPKNRLLDFNYFYVTTTKILLKTTHTHNLNIYYFHENNSLSSGVWTTYTNISPRLHYVFIGALFKFEPPAHIQIRLMIDSEN